LINLVDVPVMVLEGGTTRWLAARFEASTGLPRPIGELDDTYTDFAERYGDDAATINAAFRRTIAWRGRLVTKYRNDSTLPFLT